MKKKLEPGMAYNMEKLNKVFAGLAVVFLIVVFWVFLDDYTRPWKKYQLEALSIKKDKIESEISAAKKAVDEGKLEELNAQLVAGEKIVKERKTAIKAVEKELALNKRDLTDETIINGQLNAKIGEVNFNYEIAVSHKYSTEKKLFNN